MTTVTIDHRTLETLHRRWSAGEKIARLAAEIGLSWQRLHGELTRRFGSPSPHRAVSTAKQVGRDLGTVSPMPVQSAGSGPVTERYRPRSLDALVGQPAVVRFLERLANDPYPTALLFEGETGTGKTSAALALAAALGCDPSQDEFGGVYQIASGEQTADSVRAVCRQMAYRPLYGSGWKVIIVNEVDRISLPAETIWLDRLEALPNWTVVVFTTNDASRLSSRFCDRCQRLRFEADAGKLAPEAAALLAGIWQAERGEEPDMVRIGRVIDDCVEGGKLSIRRCVQRLSTVLAEME
jgi:hypothetical protein